VPKDRPVIYDLDALKTRYKLVRQQTETLATHLSVEVCQIQSMTDASPIKWHLAHTSWFFETFILKQNPAKYQEFAADFQYLFNSYYNGIGEQYPRARRGLMLSPVLSQVMEYRRWVDQHMLILMDNEHLDKFQDLLWLGLHHEQQHQELMLTDLKHALWQSPHAQAYQQPPVSQSVETVAAIKWQNFEKRICHVGQQNEGFCFDNETPQHECLVLPYALADRCVTNAEYLAFIKDGGYQNPELWLSDGWSWVKQNNLCHPLYWHQQHNEWDVFSLFGKQPLKLNEPVCHLSFYEASAYALWAGARLPTEFEWESACHQLTLAPAETEISYHPHTEPGAFSRMFNNVWQWTRSDYAPYPGFKPAKGAVGEYNGKFMCNQYVLRGGSCVTPKAHVRASYRNFFYPDARWQFSGLRLAKNN